MTKSLLFLMLTALLCACSRDSDEHTRGADDKAIRLGILPGVLAQIDRNLWIQAEEVRYPELRDVILYAREDSAELQTFYAAKATMQEGKEGIIRFTLHEVSLSVGESSENQEAILMDSHTFEVLKVSGWSYPPSSPFDEQDPAKAENSSFQYKVNEGDDIQSISKRFAVTEADLKRWNPELTSSDHLDVGQLILIKGGVSK